MSGCPFVNVVDPDTYSNGVPFAEFKRMRDSAPLVHMDDPLTGVPYWVATRCEVIDEISKNPKVFSSAERTAFPMEYDDELVKGVHQHMFINMDPPKHIKYRKIVRKVFTPRAVAALEGELHEHAKRIVGAVLPRGECEWVEDVASELPLLAILEMLGIPVDQRKNFFEWTNTMIFADDPDMATTEEEGQLAALEVINYALGMAAEYRRDPTTATPVVHALLGAEVDGEPLSEEDFSWIFVLLLVGGNETTRTAIAQAMRLLLEHPDQLAWLQANPDRIPDACEEVLRYNGSFISMRRTVMEDIEIAGTQLHRGDKVVLLYQSANHEEAVFGDDAGEFDIRRAERMPQLYNELRSFGAGQHFCIGTHLARLEMRLIMHEALTRMHNIQAAGPVKGVRSYFVSAIQKLPIRFDAVPA
jgi:cytochrome P450